MASPSAIASSELHKDNSRCSNLGEEVEGKKRSKGYHRISELAQTDEAPPRSTSASLLIRSLQTEFPALSSDLIKVLSRLVSDVEAARRNPSRTTSTRVPAYKHQFIAPERRRTKRLIVWSKRDWRRRKDLYALQRTIPGLDGPITDQDLADIDGLDSGDDKYDEFIGDNQWDPIWGFLLHRQTGKFIGKGRIGEVIAFLESAYICLARSGKLEKSFGSIPLGTRIILVNAVEDGFFDYTKSQGHYKALLCLRLVANHVGLSRLIKTYGSRGPPIPLSPSHPASFESITVPGSVCITVEARNNDAPTAPTGSQSKQKPCEDLDSSKKRSADRTSFTRITRRKKDHSH